MPKKKINPQSKKKRKKVDNSYIITDKYMGEIKIKHTANAWWKDRSKVGRLILAYKMDCKPAEVRVLAGINDHQRKYFLKEHPTFSAILEDMRKVPTVKARTSLIAKMQIDGALALKYLERKEPDEFKERKEVEVSDKPILIDDVMGDD